jgi:sirohydrochlorin ferrochelatase
MASSESNSLFPAIETFLRQCRSEGEIRSCRAFWQSRAVITAAEIAMLASLGDGWHCAEALAEKLGRDPASTRQFLDALVSVGILERRGERYAASAPTIRYCHAVTRGQLPR